MIGIDSFRGIVRKASNHALSISDTDGESSRTFASYSIYKGKGVNNFSCVISFHLYIFHNVGAVSLKIIPPTLVPVQSSNGASIRYVDR